MASDDCSVDLSTLQELFEILRIELLLSVTPNRSALINSPHLQQLIAQMKQLPPSHRRRPQTTTTTSSLASEVKSQLPALPNLQNAGQYRDTVDGNLVAVRNEISSNAVPSPSMLAKRFSNVTCGTSMASEPVITSRVDGNLVGVRNEISSNAVPSPSKLAKRFSNVTCGTSMASEPVITSRSTNLNLPISKAAFPNPERSASVVEEYRQTQAVPNATEPISWSTIQQEIDSLSPAQNGSGSIPLQQDLNSLPVLQQHSGCPFIWFWYPLLFDYSAFYKIFGDRSIAQQNLSPYSPGNSQYGVVPPAHQQDRNYPEIPPVTHSFAVTAPEKKNPGRNKRRRRTTTASTRSTTTPDPTVQLECGYTITCKECRKTITKTDYQLLIHLVKHGGKRAHQLRCLYSSAISPVDCDFTCHIPAGMSGHWNQKHKTRTSNYTNRCDKKLVEVWCSLIESTFPSQRDRLERYFEECRKEAASFEAASQSPNTNRTLDRKYGNGRETSRRKPFARSPVPKAPLLKRGRTAMPRKN